MSIFAYQWNCEYLFMIWYLSVQQREEERKKSKKLNEEIIEKGQ